MEPVTVDLTGWNAWSQEQADAARIRHDLRLKRLHEAKAAHETMLAERAARMREKAKETPDSEQDRKKALIQAAMERVRKKKEGS